jgi:lipopolysaccharide transport system permease protein
MSTTVSNTRIRPSWRATPTPQEDKAAFGRPDSPCTVCIEPSSGWPSINLGEIWQYRELFLFLTWRDISVRYKQTVLGAAWAIIQPVMTMVVFTIFFGKFGGMAKHVEGSYAVFVYAALLPWNFFATSVNQSGQSLLSGRNLVSKVYFPRLIIPIAAVGGGLVDFAISFAVMICLMVVYAVTVSANLFLVPLFVAGTVVTAVGVGTILSALVAAYRDFRYVINFLVQIWMFASPVAYPLSVVPEQWRPLYALNPMVGMISGFRSCILNEPFGWDCIGVSFLSTAMLFVCGAFYFRRVERRLADII